ncbi:phosphate uptake regulator, PhoU [Desulfotomaculum nigrificans CO-1-SRB]|uniref:Phosphate-specific transport system accessory protein PhoU n=1 Tax=Desulfotomaculum nigrificans (strain DSM 14880 / VKM B-2319 / CO-1-SRB) TaxID=868595 RepID=F6B6T3_DESCC|nr:phosphate signaling complex protein PhoU [Desulfotomaculum nigrificans]AEF93258.1 phosphate uptake regulator, PhoU [Desulfotomaculum nigrificans CO-1-SRB]
MSTRQSFDLQLMDLQQHILRMASLVERAIYDAVESLTRQDTVLAQKVIDSDDAIDEFLNDIEHTIIKIIATQQPIARDLRVAITGLKIIISLERMADFAVDIAKITLRLAGEKLIKPLVKINEMARLAQQMVKEGLDAYVQSDVTKARRMCGYDDDVDYYFHEVFEELIVFMKNEPRCIEQASHLLLVCRYLERIADYATNIGEEVVYLITGSMEDMN